MLSALVVLFLPALAQARSFLRKPSEACSPCARPCFRYGDTNNIALGSCGVCVCPPPGATEMCPPCNFPCIKKSRVNYMAIDLNIVHDINDDTCPECICPPRPMPRFQHPVRPASNASPPSRPASQYPEEGNTRTFPVPPRRRVPLPEQNPDNVRIGNEKTFPVGPPNLFRPPPQVPSRSCKPLGACPGNCPLGRDINGCEICGCRQGPRRYLGFVPGAKRGMFPNGGPRFPDGPGFAYVAGPNGRGAMIG